VRRLMRGGHHCVVYDVNPNSVKSLSNEGAAGTTSFDDFVAQLTPPRVAWVMVPAGAPTEDIVNRLAERMERGDIIIDAGNSYFKADGRRAAALHGRDIRYVDVGTSGGLWGLERGYCLMVGGALDAVQHLAPIFTTLAPGRGDIPPTPGREHRDST